jgi:type IV pilus assembly protein PilC
MPTFVFQAKALGGKIQKGEIEADSDVDARVKLRAQHLIPVKIFIKGQNQGFKFDLSGFKKSVPPKELQIMTRQFSTLINSGIPVMQSMEILANGTKHVTLRESLLEIKTKLEGGRRLADAMDGKKNVFDNLYVNMVRAGEEGGVLDVILNRLATYIEKSVKLKAKITGALWYPAGIMTVAMIVIFAIMTYVIPQFEDLFKSSGKELPWLTQVVIAMSHWVRDFWWLIIGGIAAAIFGTMNFYKSVDGRRKMDAWLIGFPIFGPLLQKGAIARFSRTLSTLLSSGVGIIEALDISAKVCGNSTIEDSLIDAKKSISEGKSIIVPLLKNKYIPDMVVQMIGVGEQTGAMDVMLEKVADFYEDEVDYAVGALTSVMEPLLMVVLGGIIAFLVVAMYLPIFDLASGFG